MNLIINKNEFMDIVDLVKAMKTDIFYISGPNILGTDSEFRTLKIVRMNSVFPIKVLATTLSLQSFVKGFSSAMELSIDTETGTIMEYPCIGFSSIFNCNLLHPDFYNTIGRIEYLYNISEFLNTRKPDVYIQSLHSTDSFLEAMGKKSKDGNLIFDVGQYADTDRHYLISTYSGLLPVNKSDKLNLSIYDLDDSRFMAHFSILKKKLAIELYISYLRL